MGGEQTRARLRELAARHGLSAAAEERLWRVAERVAADRRAPTAIRAPRAIVERHVADSLVALELDPVRVARRLADIGSGSGFPGVALAAALPDATVRLVESRRERCAYLRALCADAAIANVQAVCARAEEWHEGAGDNDVVLARALAQQPTVLEYAAPLLCEGGTLVDWRGERDRVEEAAASRAAGELGLRCVEIREVRPFPDARNLHLHLYVKVSDTPSRFPRRAGVARRKPLGATS